MLCNYPIFYIRIVWSDEAKANAVIFPADGIGRYNPDLIDVYPGCFVAIPEPEIIEFFTLTGIAHEYGSWYSKRCLWFETREEMVLFALKFGLSSRGVEGTDPF